MGDLALRASPATLPPPHQGVLSHLGSGRVKTPEMITAPLSKRAVLSSQACWGPANSGRVWCRPEPLAVTTVTTP